MDRDDQLHSRTIIRPAFVNQLSLAVDQLSVGQLPLTDLIYLNYFS